MAFGNVIDAPIQEAGPVPAYKIVEYNTPWEKEVAHFDEKTRTIERSKVIIEKGYLVVFPRGHSMLIEATEAALRRHGFEEVVPLITLAGESEVSEEAPKRTTQRVIHTA